GGQADIGAFEVQAVTPPPCVAGNTVIINGGAVQRSLVTTIEVDFDQVVNLPATPGEAFQLQRLSDNALIGSINAVADNSSGKSKVMLTFSGANTESGSLADGRYALTVFASKVSNANGILDGNCDGTGGDNYVLAADPTPNPPGPLHGIFRFFGDVTGN